MKNWPTKKLGEVADFLDNLRKPITASDRIPGPYPYYGANGQQDSINDYIFDDELILLAEDGGYFGSKTRPVAYRVSGKCWVNNHAHVLKNKNGVSDIDYLGYSLMYYDVTPYISGTTRAKLNKSEAMKIPIQIPPLSIQKKIVERLDAIRKAQELCDQQIQKTKELFESLTQYRKKGINEYRKLGEIVSFKTGKLNSNAATKGGKYPFFTCAEEIFRIDTYAFDTECVLLAGNNASGVFPIKYFYGKFNAYQRTYIIESLDRKNLNTIYLYFMLRLELENLRRQSVGGLTRFLTLGILRKIKIPFPNIKEQQKIVEKLKAAQNYKKLLQKQKELLKELFDSVLDKSMKGKMDN